MKFLIGLLVLAAVVAAARLGYSQFIGHVISRSSAKPPVCLELNGYTTTEEEGHTSIIGKVANNCDYEFDTVNVVFLLDRTAINLSAAPIIGHLRNIKPGQTKDFKTMPIGRDTSYSFSEMTAY